MHGEGEPPHLWLVVGGRLSGHETCDKVGVVYKYKWVWSLPALPGGAWNREGTMGEGAKRGAGIIPAVGVVTVSYR